MDDWIPSVSEESLDVNEELDDVFPDDYVGDEVDNTTSVNYSLVDTLKTYYTNVYSMDVVFERLYKHRLITQKQRQYLEELRDDDIVQFKNNGYSVLQQMLSDPYSNTSDKLELKKQIIARIVARHH